MKTLNWQNFDFLLLGAVAVLPIFGITMIRSAVAGNIELLELNLVGRQLIFAVAGFVVIIIATIIDYHFWASLSQTIYIVMAGLLAILFAAGAVFFGSARWFDTGVILIQPSELAKIVIIIVLANFFSLHKSEELDLKLVARSFLLTLGIVTWILLQPNLSTSIVILVLWFALLWAAGLQLKHLAMFIGIGALAPIVSYPFLVVYQKRRISTSFFRILKPGW
jgi:rod shape determining protein RodA